MKVTVFSKNILTVFILFLSSSIFGGIIPSPPYLTSKSYILMDALTGSILVEKDSHEYLPTASLTKLMTAYIASKELSQGHFSKTDLVTISENSWKTGGSRMFLDVGSKVSVDDLLHGIIIQSGNDASVALAEYIAGSTETFADFMNQTAEGLGMHDSRFINPTGLPDPDHYSSAYDMAVLARAIILEEPNEYLLYSIKHFTWNNIKQYNRNTLLWHDKTVDGLKTGYTDKSGYCMVTSALKDNTRLIAVVLGSATENTRSEETQKLLTYGFRFFDTERLYPKNTKLAEVKLWKGEINNIKAGLVENLAISLPKGNFKDLVITKELDNYLTAPVEKGKRIGKVIVKYHGETLRVEDLVSLESADKGSIFIQIWDSICLFLFRMIFN